MINKIDPTVPHPDYEDLEKKYDLDEDAFEGDVCEYVPKLAGQTPEEYKAYSERAAYFNVVQPTCSALVGAMTRKPYVLTGMPSFPNNEYGTGDAFLQTQFRDLLLGARVGILVDVGADGKSVLVPYDADDIINWTDRFIMIEQETLVPSTDNPYELVEEKSWRELYLDEQGFYAVRIWHEDENGNYYAEELEPMLVNGRRLDYIPLWVVTPYDNTWEIYNPPLHSQAALNIEHYKRACDIAHYAHFMALPTFTIVGELATDDTGAPATIKIGSTTTPLHLRQGSEAKYVEISGASSSFLQSELKNIEERMYVAGSRLMTTKKGIESAEALQIRSGSESAVLATMVNAMESALNGALQLCAEIDRVSGPVEIVLNKDFTAAQMDPQTIKALLDLFTNGAITKEQLMAKLLAGEVVDDSQPIVPNMQPNQ